jgi:glucose-1-phosphate adenylyltransferase
MDSMNNILAVILGGGRGARLYPLTKYRSKPAVPMGGKYRLIDVPISNCINSGLYRIAVLTQFNSVSLHRHISRTYTFDAFHTGYVQIWAAEQTSSSSDWYQGTADAVRKQLWQIKSADADFVLILAGDHLYRMDYAAMADFHCQNKADITVAVQPVARHDANRFGILKRDPGCRITNFAEKPIDPKILEEMVSRDDKNKPYLGSMGIYMFKTDVLMELVGSTTFDDFGGDVIPYALDKKKVFGYDFNGYWEDIGTIRSFYDTNLALTLPEPPFNMFDANNPIYTAPLFLPCSHIINSSLEQTLLADGCWIDCATIRHSSIGVRSRVEHGSQIVDSIIMGADYYEKARLRSKHKIPIGIGPGCQIDGAIIDKNARLGAGVIIRKFPRGTDMDMDDWVVRDGIVVVPKDVEIPAGTRISPEIPLF